MMQPGPLRRGQAAQVGQPLLGDDDLHRVLVVIDVGAHRHDGRDPAALGHRGHMKIDR